MNLNKGNLISIAASVVVLIAVAIFFTMPVFKGKQLKQYDIIQHKGMSKEILDYREKGETILWTNSMFSGMPAYMIETKYDGSVMYYVNYFFRNTLPHPTGLIVMMLLGFYILMLSMKVDTWLSVAGAIAFTFSTYFIIVITAGHNAKVHAIAYLPPLFAGLYMAYRRSLWLGVTIFSLFFALELMANHPQMTYYFSFFALAFIVAEFFGALAEKKLVHFAKVSGLLLLGTLLAVGSHWGYLKTTLDYGKYTIRGTSELTSNQENKTKGLDRDYITQWSYGIDETLTLLVPNYKGGASAQIAEHKDALKHTDPQYRQVIGSMNAYWGDQPSQSGPVYVGAFVFVLFFFALFALKDRMKWAVIVTLFITVMLSWGKNFQGFTDLFLDYFPGYNKFRAVSSILIVAELLIPMMAIFGIAAFVQNAKLWDEPVQFLGKKMGFDYKKLFIGVSGIFALYTFILAVAPDMLTSFFASGEYDELSGEFEKMGAGKSQISDILAELEAARAAILKSDALRSFIIILIGAGLVISYAYMKYSKYILVGGLGLLIAGDMISIDKRYMSEQRKDFVEVKKGLSDLIPETQADRIILSDKNLSFRVLNLTKSPFNDATTSYRHKSIGGYHGAKLKKYQELIENSLYPDISKLSSVFRKGTTMAQVDSAFALCGGLNMLNTKYIILDDKSMPIINESALGNAWFVSSYKVENTADDELKTLLSVNPRDVAVLDKNAGSAVSGLTLQKDSSAFANLVSYHPEKMQYETNNRYEGLLVFSEIYYPEGWYATIDGIDTEILKADYTLRALRVPAGSHKIEMVFAPNFWRDQKISFGFSLALLLFCGVISFKPLQAIFKGKSETGTDA
jgi:hypothetical protein